MTIRSREYALKCAASLPPHLLFRGWPKHRSTDQDNTLSNLGLYGRVSDEMAEQLTNCKDEAGPEAFVGDEQVIRPRRTLRRGEPTPAEKNLARNGAYLRAQGHCELDPWLSCCGGRQWPLVGGLRERGHLVHLRNKRMWGWGGQNVCWGCAEGTLRPDAHQRLAGSKDV